MSIVRNLVVVHFDLYKHVHEQSKYKNHFGQRNFYFLIKEDVNGLIYTLTEQQSYTIVQRQLAIHFDGIFDGSQLLCKCLCKYANQEYLIEQAIP
ncbi:unnamed protein product [Rotaria sp. Silwood1]|nr:unnamed protein product [Rotaria sp. Silwood1]CAF4648605.1 unnamed protein product [Rotaria sp. Silwood1]